ncbi:MAG: hypothetical protein II281_01970, partial [Alistipes sp.]|nr:hypothetical protein [Alistipes sp.]
SEALFFIVLSARVSLNPNINHRTAFCRQSGAFTTLNEKCLRRIVLKRTAIAGIFVSGSRYPRYHDKINY